MAFGRDFVLAVRRVTQGEFFTPMAVDAEREVLRTIHPAIDEPQVQDYVVWRRALLMISALLFGLHMAISLINYTSIESSITDAAIAAQESTRGAPLSEQETDQVRAGVVKQMGKGNLATLEIWPIVSLLATIAATVLAILAAWRWLQVPASRRLARAAFYVSIVTPLVLCVIPWSSLVDFGHLGADAQTMTKSLAFIFSLLAFFSLAPKLVSLFPGLMRSGMMLKTMFYESPTPAYVTVMAAPVFIMMLLIVFSTMIQLEGKWSVMLGLVCLLLSAGVYLLRARDLVRTHTKEEAIRSVQSAGFLSMVFSGLGVLFIAIYVFTMDSFGFFEALNFFTAAGANLLLTMAVASDYLLGGLSRQLAAAKAFVGSEQAESYGKKMCALEAAGMTQWVKPAATSDE